jgi:hypothetical protein
MFALLLNAKSRASFSRVLLESPWRKPVREAQEPALWS